SDFHLPASFSAGHPTFSSWAIAFNSSFALLWSFTIRAPKFFASLSVAFFSATRPIATSIIPPLAASLMKALSAELSALALALLLPLSDFDLGFWAKAVPLRPMQTKAMTPIINRIFMENLFFIDFDKIKGAELKVRQTCLAPPSIAGRQCNRSSQSTPGRIGTFPSRRHVFVAVVRLVNLLHAGK